jgi:anti-sigma B factor antagonist
MISARVGEHAHSVRCVPDDADHQDPSDARELDPPVIDVVPTPTGLRVEGELDLATAPVLAAHLDPLPSWCHDVVIDVAGLRFVDSTGLGVLLRAHHVARDEGRRLLLASPSDRLRRLLEISALADILLVAEPDDLDDDELDDVGDVDDGADGGTAGVSV